MKESSLIDVSLTHRDGRVVWQFIVLEMCMKQSSIYYRVAETNIRVVIQIKIITMVKLRPLGFEPFPF
jgi:hypothetical protein